MTGVAGGKEFREDAGTVGALSKDDSAIITPPPGSVLGKVRAVPTGRDSGPSSTLKHPSLMEESGQERRGICLKPMGPPKGLFLAHKKKK